MPFVTPSDGQVELRRYPPRPWLRLGPVRLGLKLQYRLETPITYLDQDGTTHTAPRTAEGTFTDLASVPWLLWGVLASNGRNTLPALLHDHLCGQAAGTPDPAQSRHLRRVADRVFRHALVDQGVARVRAWMMWAAVRLFGQRGWDVAWALVSLVATAALLGRVVALAGVDLGVVTSLARRPGWWTGVVVAVTAAVAITRTTLAGATAIAVPGVVVVAPAAVGALASSIVIFLASALGWFVELLVSPFASMRPVPPVIGPFDREPGEFTGQK